ncbi:MAG: hypothetical protein AB1345_06110 [Chloroflexota bacterium]
MFFIVLSMVNGLLTPQDTHKANPTTAPEAGMVGLTSPLPGQALQGLVAISGSTDAEGFERAELYIGYAQDATNTWFLIYESTQPLTQALLTNWDTTQITDGTYTLRLLIVLQDGDFIQVLVPELRIRNYTPIETNTPTSTATPDSAHLFIQTATPSPTSTPPPPTRTPYPPNPAEIQPPQISGAIICGAVGTLLLFGLIGLHQFIRSRMMTL